MARKKATKRDYQVLLVVALSLAALSSFLHGQDMAAVAALVGIGSLRK
jgi:hypothetical protein